MELVDYPRRSPVTDLEPTLEQRRRALLVLDYDLRRLAEQLVAIRVVQALRVGSARFLGFLLPNGLDDVFLARTVVDDETLSLERCLPLLASELVPAGESLGVLARDVRALKACRLRLARRNEQHLAVTEH